MSKQAAEIIIRHLLGIVSVLQNEYSTPNKRIMMSNTKKLSEITRDEWILWEWVSVREAQDTETKYLRGVERDPSTSIRAGVEYDEWRKEYETQK